MKTTDIAKFMERNGFKRRGALALALDLDIGRLRRWIESPEEKDLPIYIGLAFSALEAGLRPYPESGVLSYNERRALIENGVRPNTP